MTVLIKTVSELREIRAKWRKEGLTVGLVPTMGYLHRGHQSLIQRAKEDNDKVIVSDFLNPLQFGPSEDLSKYPRDLDKDLEAVMQCGADILFYPSANEMYGADFGEQELALTMVVPPKDLTNTLCGLKRPGHFEGVCTVVAKLFNIVEPESAYFGKKDYQQLVIIRKMVADTNRNLQVVGCPIVREEDGLALSSRNIYLNQSERQAALVLNRALTLAKRLIDDGASNANDVVCAVTKFIESEPLAKIDYVSFVDAIELKPLSSITEPALLALAVFIGEDVHRTRLIDNFVYYNEKD
ncbi:pantothenate synthetase [Actinomycetota bacterium]|nr:pantothenate synthetase [Actinomycetota bacterium]